MDIDDNKKKYLERIKKKNEKIQNIDTTKNILNTDIKKYTIKKIKIDQIKNIKNNNIKINKINNIKINNINNIKINNINNNNKNNLLNQYNILTTDTRDTSKTLNIVKLKEYSPKYAINKSFNNSNMKNKLPNNKFNLYKAKKLYIPNIIKIKKEIYNNNPIMTTFINNNLHYESIFNNKINV